MESSHYYSPTLLFICLIKYDCEQHYVPVKFGNMTDEEAEEKLHNTQKRDEIKNKYCKDNIFHC